jgi:hypothetical protein
MEWLMIQDECWYRLHAIGLGGGDFFGVFT